MVGIILENTPNLIQVMENITIKIEGHSYRATEVISDLRIAVETLYGPMKMVGFWDRSQGIHLCPYLERQQDCQHTEPTEETVFPDYEKTLQRERQASLAVIFPHANVTLYLS